MTLKNQLNTIKDNWLIAGIVLVLVVMSISGGGESIMAKSSSFGGYAQSMEYAMESPAPMMAESRGMIIRDEGFAPDIQTRKVTKTSSMTLEIERGVYNDAESRLKSIVSSTDSILLNENVWKHGTKRKQYRSGQYTIQIQTSKYDAVVAQFKELGKVESFQENANDVTERYTNVEIEIAAETERLARYKKMYEEATRVEDKINLNDRIFNQERQLKYLKDSLENIDERIEYTRVSVSMDEKQSEYMDIAFVKVSELINSLVSSINSLLHLLFIALPYALVIGLGMMVYRFLKRKKR